MKRAMFCRLVVAALGLYLGLSASGTQGAILQPNGAPTPGDPNLKAWFKANDGVVVSGAAVTRWVDKSVVTPDANRDLVSPSGNEPTYKSSEPTLNGLPAVSFDGVNDFLQRAANGNPLANNSPVTGNSDRTVFVVISNSTPRPNTNNIEHVFHFGNAEQDRAYGVLVRAGGPNFGNHYWVGTDPGTTPSSSAPYVVCFAYDGNNIRGATGRDMFYVNGQGAGTIDARTTVQNGLLNTGSNEFKVGARILLSGGNPVEHYQGDIAELIIYDSLLRYSEMAQVHSYLGQKYGISAGLPAPVHTARYANFSSVADWTLNGDATQFGDRIRLTPAAVNQTGSAMMNRRIALGAHQSFSFQAHFAFNINNPGGSSDPEGAGADGLTFILHDQGSGPYASGALGAGMGARGIEPFVMVEFDTWHQGDFDPPGNTNTNGNHIAVNVSGEQYSRFQTGQLLPAFQDGVTRYVWIDYNGVTDVMNIYLSTTPTKPAAPTLSGSIDLGAIFGSAPALFVGFTAGTGSAYANHEILFFEIQAIPEPSSFVLAGAGLLGLVLLGRRRVLRSSSFRQAQGV